MAFTQNLAGGHLTSGLHSTPLNSLLRISIQMPYSISDSLCPKLKSPSIPSRLPKLSTTTTTLFQPYFASLSLSSPNGKPTLLPFIIHNHWSLCLINATFQTSHSEPLKVCWVLTLRCPLHTTPHTASRVDFLTDEMYIIPLLKNSLCSFRIEYKPQITYMALHIRGSSHTHHSAVLQILSILLPCLPLPRITS